MTAVTSMNAMPLGEANRLLASISYSPEWTLEELKAAADRLPADVCSWLPEALRVTAAAASAEAAALRAEVERRKARRGGSDPAPSQERTNDDA